eukprot:1400952-Ditylum_brightwellii.AAC.2
MATLGWLAAVPNLAADCDVFLHSQGCNWQWSTVILMGLGCRAVHLLLALASICEEKYERQLPSVSTIQVA